MFKLSLLT